MKTEFQRILMQNIMHKEQVQVLSLLKGRLFHQLLKGVLHIPGLYTAEQTEGWKLVTSAVHEKGSKIYTQLWHVGRVSHVSNQPDRQAPVAPSDIQAANSNARVMMKTGKKAL